MQITLKIKGDRRSRGSSRVRVLSRRQGRNQVDRMSQGVTSKNSRRAKLRSYNLAELIFTSLKAGRVQADTTYTRTARGKFTLKEKAARVKESRRVSTKNLLTKQAMDRINEQHASHIGRVKVDFLLSALELDPATITDWTGLHPDKMAKRGDERRNYNGDLIAPHDEGFWMISSEGKVNSKDINDHLGFLLRLLLPHRDKLLRVTSEMNGEAYFDVLWTSNYLYAGTGPIISRESLQGMSDLGAGIGFDIYQYDIDPSS